MSISIMKKTGPLEVPTRGGGISLELLARISALESTVEGLTKSLGDANTEIQRLSGLRATHDRYGMAKICDLSTVTDSEGLVLPASQNNAAINGSLANRIKKLGDRSLVVQHRLLNVNEQYVESQWGNIYSIFNLGFYFLDIYFKNIPETQWGETITIAKSGLVPVTNCSIIAATSSGTEVCVIIDANNGNVLLDPKTNTGNFNIRCHFFQLAHV